MQLFLLGLNILLLAAVWRLMLRKTILDHHRDRLFDLRDELRAKFVENGWDLDSAIYKRLRNLMNGYLRFTEEFSIVPFVVLEARVQANSELCADLKATFDKEFHVSDTRLTAFVNDYRVQARSVMLGYMIYSSWPILLMCYVLAPIVALNELIGVFNRGLSRGLKAVALRFRNIRSSAGDALDSAQKVVAKKVFVPDFVEEYSYRIGGDLPSSPRRAAAC